MIRLRPSGFGETRLTPGVGRGGAGVGRGFRGRRSAWRGGGSPAVIALWLAGAFVIWNAVFDAHIVRGAAGYVERQQLFAEGRGPRVDIDQAMGAAKRQGVRVASLWAGGELAAGATFAAAVSVRRRRRAPDATRAASR